VGIDTILTEYAELYRSTLSPEQLNLYIEALHDCSVTEVRAAMRQLARDAKWMPRPAEILDCIRAKRAEAARQANTQQLTQAASAKPLRSHFRVPSGVSIIEHVESLRADGLTLDAIADKLCGPEDPTTERRYHCHHCQDTGLTRVWHPEAMRAAYRDRDHRGRTCTLPCDCHRGKSLAENGRKWSYHFAPDKMVRVTGDRQRDEELLQAKAAAIHEKRKHREFAAYEHNPHEDLA
jgi:hypothetical protein